MFRFLKIFFAFLALSTPSRLLCDIATYQADYVVVGMGAAGAGVAKILSDDNKHSVIGIEAGGDYDDQKPIFDSTFAPLLEPNYFPNYFYQLQQVNQVNADDAQFNYTTGRALGGGSSINGLQDVWGSLAVYTQWEELLGPTWSTRSIFKTFKKVETYHGITTDPSERGRNGPVSIRQAPVNPTSMATKFVNATVAATGFPEIIDYNVTNTPIGPFTRWQLFQKISGLRESSSTAYLKPYVNDKLEGKGKRKLRILDRTTVVKILFKGNKAVGVRVLKNGKFANVCANKKVILCAGIYSNWLLQVSGIGPKDQLQSVGIEVLFDNPAVGQGLKNQLVSVATFKADPADVGVPPNDPAALYVGGAFLPDPTPPVDPTRRGIELIGISSGSGNFTLAIIATQPKSTGTVMVQSGDYLQIPLVNDNAFSNPADLQTFINAYRSYVLPIANQLHAIDPLYVLDTPDAATIADDDKLTDYILSTINHTHHWTGTCRMAPLDQGGVVDVHGNVYGVENLVVADDSIAPFIPDGNTAACAFMIGRKIALDISKQN